MRMLVVLGGAGALAIAVAGCEHEHHHHAHGDEGQTYYPAGSYQEPHDWDHERHEEHEEHERHYDDRD
jgi:hypothetical protein